MKKIFGRNFLMVCIASLAVTAAQAENLNKGKMTEFRLADWKGIRLADNCNMKKKVGLKDRVEKAREDGKRFLRFSLENGEIGSCGSDPKPRNNAPYWERAELKQTKSLKKNAHYSLTFDARFVEGMAGYRETFWQLHGWHKTCKAKPSAMLMFEDGDLLIKPLQNGKLAKKVNTGQRIADLKGGWHRFRMEFTTAQQGDLAIYLNDALIAKTPFEMSDCAVPHVKFGIYRPGANDGHINETSVVDFGAIQLKRID